MMYNSTLCYVTRGNDVLMLHRVKKKNDINKDKWIGIGGSCTDHVTDHALLTWLSCTAHVAVHAMNTQLPCTGHMTDHALIT